MRFGKFVITATLIATLSGCASTQPKTLTVNELWAIPVHCERRDQLIEFFESQRATVGQRQAAGFANLVQPWTLITDGGEFMHRQEIVRGKHDWVINQRLMEVQNQCG